MNEDSPWRCVEQSPQVLQLVKGRHFIMARVSQFPLCKCGKELQLQTSWTNENSSMRYWDCTSSGVGKLSLILLIFFFFGFFGVYMFIEIECLSMRDPMYFRDCLIPQCVQEPKKIILGLL